MQPDLAASERNFTDHVARVRADHATAQSLAVAPASMAAF